jgi:hypothetical protein
MTSYFAPIRAWEIRVRVRVMAWTVAIVTGWTDRIVSSIAAVIDASISIKTCDAI